MPTFVFKSPEGKEYEITGPDGSTSEQAWEILQKQLGTQKPQAPKKENDIIKGAKGTAAFVGDLLSGAVKIPAAAALAVGGKLAYPEQNLQESWKTAQAAMEETFPSFGKGMEDNKGYSVPMYPLEKYGQGVESAAKVLSGGNPNVEGAINIAGQFAPVPFVKPIAKGLGKVAETVDPGLRNVQAPPKPEPLLQLPETTPKAPDLGVGKEMPGPVDLERMYRVRAEQEALAAREAQATKQGEAQAYVEQRQRALEAEVRRKVAEKINQDNLAQLEQARQAAISEADSAALSKIIEEQRAMLSTGENTPGGRVINRQPTTDSGLMGLPERPVEPPVGLSTGESVPGGAIINRKPVSDSGLMGEPVPDPIGLSTGEGRSSVPDPRRTPTPIPEAPDFFGSAGANPRMRLRKNQGAIHPQVFEDLYNFGKSVIRAADGTLLPLYHGTEKAFDKIKASTEGGALGNGVYLAVRPEYASGYADGAGGNVHQVYVDIRKPLVIDGPGDPMINALVALGETREKAAKIVEKAYDEKGYITNEVRVRAMRQGYDGIVQKRNGKESEVVAFKPEQVKSAISPEKSLQKPTSLRSQRGGVDPDLLTLGIPKLLEKMGLGKEKEPIAKYLEKLPGMGKEADAYITKPTPSAQLLEQAKAQADGPDLWTNLQSGLSMAAAKGDSIVLKNTAQWFNWSQARANYLIREAVVPLESRLAHLGKELQSVHRVFVDEMFKGAQYTPEQLTSMGLSQKAVGAYQALRKNFDMFFAEQNKARELLGRKPITRQDAYMASIFRGDYHLPVYDKTGKLRFYIQSPTRKQHQAAINWLKQEFANSDVFDFSKLKYDHSTMYNPGRKFGSMPRDVMASWKEIAEAMGDDPLAAEIKTAMERWVEAKGEHAFRQDLHHVKVKTNVRGFEGDQPWLSPKENAHNWAQAQIDYLKDAARWAATQEAIANTKTFLTDPTILENQPNNVALGKAYMYNHMGLTENLTRRLEEGLSGQLGLSKDFITDLGTLIRTGVYFKTLVASPGYIVATPLQAIWASMGHYDMAKKQGLVKTDYASFMRNMFEAMSDDRVGTVSSFNKEALKWAEDNGVIQNVVYEDNKSLGSHALADASQWMLDKSIGLPDRFARRTVFLPFANAFWQSGKYATKAEAFRAAGEITDSIAVSMRPQDRPLAVQKLGQLGQLAYQFHSPIVNMYNNLSTFAHYGKKTGNWGPLAKSLLAMGAVGGVFSLPLVNELEKGSQLIKDVIANLSPKTYAKIKGFDPKLSLLQALPEITAFGHTGGEWASYGAASVLLGADMRGRFSNEILNADDPVGSLLPSVSVYGGMAESLGKAAINPNPYTGMQALKDIAPGGLARGMIETSSDRFKAASQPWQDQGITSFRKPSDITEPGVYVNRTEDDIMKRRFGVTSLNEAITREKDAVSDREAKRLREAREKTFNSMFKAIVNKTGDDTTVREAVQTYLELDGNPKDIERQLERKFADLPFTRQQQQMLKAKRYEQIMNVVRRLEMEKR